LHRTDQIFHLAYRNLLQWIDGNVESTKNIILKEKELLEEMYRELIISYHPESIVHHHLSRKTDRTKEEKDGRENDNTDSSKQWWNETY
jgi:hypothetical protein